MPLPGRALAVPIDPGRALLGQPVGLHQVAADLLRVGDRLLGFRRKIRRFADQNVHIFRQSKSVQAKPRVHHESEALPAFFFAAFIDRNDSAADAGKTLGCS